MLILYLHYLITYHLHKYFFHCRILSLTPLSPTLPLPLPSQLSKRLAGEGVTIGGEQRH